MARIDQNLAFWLAHAVRPSFMGYAPDIATLAAGPVRVVVAVGHASTPDQVAYQASHALAERLGITPVTVPGDHDAVTRRPEQFAERLRQLLAPAEEGGS